MEVIKSIPIIVWDSFFYLILEIICICKLKKCFAELFIKSIIDGVIRLAHEITGEKSGAKWCGIVCALSILGGVAYFFQKFSSPPQETSNNTIVIISFVNIAILAGIFIIIKTVNDVAFSWVEKVKPH